MDCPFATRERGRKTNCFFGIGTSISRLGQWLGTPNGPKDWCIWTYSLGLVSAQFVTRIVDYRDKLERFMSRVRKPGDVG